MAQELLRIRVSDTYLITIFFLSLQFLMPNFGLTFYQKSSCFVLSGILQQEARKTIEGLMADVGPDTKLVSLHWRIGMTQETTSECLKSRSMVLSALDPTFISLFSGAGGLDLGLEQAGWKCVYASDLDAAAVSTLKANRGMRIGRGKRAFADTFIEQSDIRNVTAEQILSRAGIGRGDVSLLAGGPPCQSWSSAGHQHGFDDPRGRLFDDFIRIANSLDVRWLVLENVRGLLTARGPDGQPGSALAYIRKRLLKAGFQTTVSLFNAADYGVPQRRVRLIMVGFRSGDPPPFPTPTHAKPGSELAALGKPLWITLAETLSALPVLLPDEIVRPNAQLASELAKVKPGSGVKSPGKPEKTRPGGHWGYKQGAFVADLTQSARTVTANAQQDWVLDKKRGLRRLCPRECAAIQGFPENWKFDGSRVTQYRLIGNAVPPPLARALGVSLKKHVLAKQATSVCIDVKKLLPLPDRLRSAIDYTVRDERINGASRRASANRRVSRVLEVARRG